MVSPVRAKTRSHESFSHKSLQKGRRTWKRLLSFLGVLLVAVLLAGCDNIFNSAGSGGSGDSGDAGDTGDSVEGPVPANDEDADGDGLTNAEEIETYHTSAVRADTDGDGLTDYQEIREYNFDPENDVSSYNPRIADLPQVGVSFVSTPRIALDRTTGSGSTVTVEETESETVTESQTTSETNTTSSTVSTSHSAGLEIGASYTAGLFGGVSGSVTASYNFTHTSTQGQSFTWTENQTQSNSETLATARTEARSQNETIAGGTLSVAARVENRGARSFTVTDLRLSAREISPSRGRLQTSVGNLTIGDFPEGGFSLAEDDQQVFTFETEIQDAVVAERLLGATSGMTLRVAGYDLADESDTDFVFDTEHVNQSTATVMIDYPIGHDLPKERYRISTVWEPGETTITAGQALSEVLRASYQTNESGALISVRGAERDPSNNKEWVVVHRTGDETGQVLNRYGPGSDYDFESLELQPDDVLHLVLAQDNDGDGLGNRHEILAGTEDTSADSDDDGLSDFFEVQSGWTADYVNSADESVGTDDTVFSDPTAKDTDGDGMTDLQERDAGTNPNETDTDGDEAVDVLEVEPTMWDPHNDIGFDASANDAEQSVTVTMNRPVTSINDYPDSRYERLWLLRSDASTETGPPQVPAPGEDPFASDGTWPGDGGGEWNIVRSWDNANWPGGGDYTDTSVSDNTTYDYAAIYTLTNVVSDVGVENGWSQYFSVAAQRSDVNVPQSEITVTVHNLSSEKNCWDALNWPVWGRWQNGNLTSPPSVVDDECEVFAEVQLLDPEGNEVAVTTLPESESVNAAENGTYAAFDKESISTVVDDVEGSTVTVRIGVFEADDTATDNRVGDDRHFVQGSVTRGPNGWSISGTKSELTGVYNDTHPAGELHKMNYGGGVNLTDSQSENLTVQEIRSNPGTYGSYNDANVEFANSKLNDQIEWPVDFAAFEGYADILWDELPRASPQSYDGTDEDPSQGTGSESYDCTNGSGYKCYRVYTYFWGHLDVTVSVGPK